MLDHVDMGEDEAGFGGGGGEPALEGADEAEIGVGRGAERGVGEAVVVEGVGGSVGHEGWDVESVLVSSVR